MVDAGWYPDPQSTGTVRWWDGQRWTDHTMPTAQAASGSPVTEPVAPIEPVAAEYSSPSQETVSFEAPTYAGPTYDASATTAYDAVDFAPVAAPGGASFVPPLAAYTPAAPATRSSGALAALIVGAVFLVVAGVGIGFAVTRSATSKADPATTPSVSAPAPSRTPENPGSSQTPGPTPSSTATGLGAELETLQPTGADLPDGTSMSLIDGGDQVTDQRTLDGWCSMSYASEKNRVERRQWDLVQGTQSTGLSIEVVAYATPDDAAAALAEFTTYSQACKGVKLDIDGATMTQTVTSARSLAPAAGVTGEQAIARWLVPQATGPARTLYSVATVQRDEQILSIVWVNQATAFTAADLTAVNAFVAQQTRALTATVHG
jgi:hypothetical protein